MKTKMISLSVLLLGFMGYGQNYWTKMTSKPTQNLSAREAIPTNSSLYQVNLEQLKNDLLKVPQRFSPDQSHVMKFPATDGKFRDYVVQEASVMEDELQAKFPEIRSYVGWQKGNPEHTIRFSVTPQTGISVMYFDGWDVSYLDQYTDDHQSFILYKRSDLPLQHRAFDCLVEGPKVETSALAAPLVSDGKFRKYRLALAATGEYTAYHGGTVASAMSAMATTMTRVNGVYEKTISVTMVMIKNNNLLIYLNGSTDPYTNNNGRTMLSENISNINSVIGAANYDIGHVFSTGGGGVAYLGSICTSIKAGGVTGSSAPKNDPFDIDYVAHEMGHQFGGNHTFNATTGSCGGVNRNIDTAYEPGSGTTIMGYAGICEENNVQSHSDPYFHSASVNEMYAVITRSTDCSVKTSNGNQVPLADAGPNYTIPKGTAFVLTGVGSDPDNDPITYLWEQMNNESSTQPPVSTSKVGPIYRSVMPTTSPSRYFPAMSNIIANNLVTTWEVTPSVGRPLNFSLLVNDNKATGNQAARGLMAVTVANTGPFVLTSHATNIQYDAAVPTTVTWNVAGTDSTPVNAANVSILISKDAGASWSVLAASVPNNGTALVNLPNENIPAARLMVKAVDNIFFAVNSSYFSVKKALMATVDAKAKALVIYPNPATHELNVQVKNNGEATGYSIVDTTGRVVLKGAVINEKINVSKLTSGNYIITLELKDGSKVTDKLMISK